jgi:hypothetical protein
MVQHTTSQLKICCGAAFKPVTTDVEALVPAGDSLQALEPKIDTVNGISGTESGAQSGGDAFFRRIRGKDFNPIHCLEPLTSDRGAALARIIQFDKEELEALVSEPARPKEFVIELTGDYDIIRVTKD